MSRLKVFIVDDEPLARLRLKQLVEDCSDPRAEVVGEAPDAAQTIAWLQQRSCDLLLLDVQMPGASGMQLASALRGASAGDLPHPPPMVVFVTAHAQHALEAFELEALDYLTKPVRLERLQAALQRAAQRLSRTGAAAPQAGDEPTIVVHERGGLKRIRVADVLLLKAELKYVTLRTASTSYVLDEPLAELEQRFGERFLRVHRNALVSRRAVRALERRSLAGSAEDDAGEGWVVRLEGLDEWIAVSRRQVAAVREALQSAPG